jgi:hypothetical protein
MRAIALSREVKQEPDWDMVPEWAFAQVLLNC